MLNAHIRLIATAALALAMVACTQDSDEPAATRAATAEATSVADSPSPSEEGSAEAPAGWEVHESGDFSLALPEGWQPFDAETLAESGVFDQMIEDNPELEAVLQQAQAGIESGQIDFMALELGAPATDGFAENVNVGTSQFRGSASELETAAESEISAGIPTATDFESEVIELPAGEAVRLSYQYPLQTPAGDSFDVVVTQYMVLGEDSLHILTFSATEAVIADYEGTFQQMAESFATD